jgi:hypothetical protein
MTDRTHLMAPEPCDGSAPSPDTVQPLRIRQLAALIADTQASYITDIQPPQEYL